MFTAVTSSFVQPIANSRLPRQHLSRFGRKHQARCGYSVSFVFKKLLFASANKMSQRYLQSFDWSGGKRQVKTIEIVSPPEDVGRDTLSRYDMQFQAAAYAALEVLDGKGVDCVFCDYHDDFVVRKIIDGKTSYHFFQVKTKDKLNHQWSLNEIFALKLKGQKTDTESLKKVQQSFGGKLLFHGIVFDETCVEATLISNVHFKDEVVETVSQLRGKLPTSKSAKFLSDHFSSIFEISPDLSNEKSGELLSKISLAPSVIYIDKDGERFAAETRSAIFKYSEIDLTFFETRELSNGLIELVYKKSKTPLRGVTPDQIASRVGVGLNDLLEVLSISRAAYDALSKGEDPKVLKQASAIHRWLKGVGARDSMIEFASQQKVNWDLWMRNARHNYSILDLETLLASIDQLYKKWVQADGGFELLNQLLEELELNPLLQRFNGLSRELLFGAVASVVVKVYSR